MLTDRIMLLEEYLKEDPDDAFILYALALEYIKASSHDKAGEYFVKLREKHPDYLPMYYHYGKFFEKTNDKLKGK
jgi:hypothetical protein